MTHAVHKINISESLLQPGTNWIDLKDFAVECREGDILEISIQPTESPMEIRAMRFAIPKDHSVDYVRIGIPYPLPQDTDSEVVE